MRIFVGHDSTQPENTAVCVRSIERFGHKVTLLDKKDLQRDHGYKRKKEDGSTEFTYTRFLVPYLCGYKGIAMFCDSDFVWRKDPAILDRLVGDAPVTVVKHLVKQVREDHKFLAHKNEWYPRKWWSSMMVFNCDHEDCSVLTLDAVNKQTPQWLHRFEWASDIGRLDESYNYLVGYYNFNKDPVAVHFTDGTPIYTDYAHDEFAEDYNDLR